MGRLGRNSISLEPFDLQWTALQFWKLELKGEVLKLMYSSRVEWFRKCARLKIEQFHKKLPLFKKTHAMPVSIVLISFSIQIPGVVSFFTELLIGV